MGTIKERRNNINPKDYEDPTDPDAKMYGIVEYIISLETECEQTLGHVNLETITREDNSRYYICDECGKQFELESV